MNHYTIRPLDPLVLGDGRPFSADPGALAAGGLLLPMPSTLAGAARSAIGRAQSNPDWAALQKVPVHGPLLCVNGAIQAPMPADAVLMSSDDALCLVRARPSELGSDEGTDIPDGLSPLGLPSGTEGFEPSKHDPPAWMSLDQLAAWYADEELFGARGRGGVWKVPLGKDRKPPWAYEKTTRIETDRRVHVGISHETQAAAKGMLYQTTGAAYGDKQALLVRAETKIPLGVMPLGGERRLACLADGSEDAWSPAGVRERLMTATKVAMVLVTPAIFDHGFRPSGLAATLGLTSVKVVAAAMRRREAVSGWDLVKGGPKPVRWLAPAGSVYWLDIPAGEGEKLAERWLHPVSDQADDRRDGFGLAVFFPTQWGTH